jgi:hypothetical protein
MLSQGRLKTILLERGAPWVPFLSSTLVRLSRIRITWSVTSEDSPPPPQDSPPATPAGGKPKGTDKKLIAGLLAIPIGWTGAHKFYLGDIKGSKPCF